VKNALEAQYPTIPVIGSNYPPPGFNLQVAQVVQAGMLSGIGVTFWGDKVFGALGVTPPEFYNSMKNNKMTTCMGLWFFGNTIAQNLLSTGAFEIYYDGELIFSKLSSGTLPVLNMVVKDVGRAVEAKRQGGHLPKGKYQASLDQDLFEATEQDVF